MRLSPLIAIALFAAPASAQLASPVASLNEALPVCKAMFNTRHPYESGPVSSNPSQDPVVRAKLLGLTLPTADQLRAAGWTVANTERATAHKTTGWGRILLSPSNIFCSISLTPNDGRLREGDELVATVEAWVAQTYPSAVRDASYVPPETAGGGKPGEPRTITRTTWLAPDGVAVSLNVGRTHPDTRPVSFYMSVRYYPPRAAR